MYCLSVKLVVSDVNVSEVCPSDAIVVEDNIAHIDPEKCTKLRSVCRKMSKENHYVNIKVQLTAELFCRGREMKRSVKTILKEAAALLWQDIKNMRIAILLLQFIWD